MANHPRDTRADEPLRLRDNDTVCIVGGGPAGCFAALHLLEAARQRGLTLNVLLFERRTEADKCGHATCKGCAGILSARATAGLQELGIDLPREMVLEEVQHYVLHIPHFQREVAIFDRPEGDRPILSVYRGQGPMRHSTPPSASFDRFLRQEAERRGVRLMHNCVRAIEWDRKPIVVTDAGPIEADLLVLANGVNANVALSPHYGYRPPATAVMLQEECPRPDRMPAGHVGAFFGQPEDIFFGTVVPKGPYVNVSLLGRKWTTVRRQALAEFLQSPVGWLDSFFPQPPVNLCGCLSRIVVGRARRCYGDRWVAVGDAAVSRLFKDGVGSAYLTSRQAMETAVTAGIGARAFRRGYGPLCRSMTANNLVGRVLFAGCAWALERRLLAGAAMRCIKQEQADPRRGKRFQSIIWGMLTGDYSYADVLRMLVSPVTMGRYLAACCREMVVRRPSVAPPPPGVQTP